MTRSKENISKMNVEELIIYLVKQTLYTTNSRRLKNNSISYKQELLCLEWIYEELEERSIISNDGINKISDYILNKRWCSK